MPKKAKEKTEELNTKTTTKTTTTKVATTKKTATKKASNTKTTAKKTATKKTTSAKTSKSKTANTTKKTTVSTQSTEYYDLPFRYNQTLVKILAQTPNMLFIYWDISDADRRAFEKQYGENFFEITRPVLIISNTTMDYTFEVEINDFANSWYLHIHDANCNYKVELGRRFRFNFNHDTNHVTPYQMNEYLYITSSDTIEAPNDHILLDQLGKSVFFRNVKTNFIEERNISSLSYLQSLGRIYHIYDLYKELYQDELNLNQLSLDLPSSNSSPTYK